MATVWMDAMGSLHLWQSDTVELKRAGKYLMEPQADKYVQGFDSVDTILDVLELGSDSVIDLMNGYVVRGAMWPFD